MSDEENKDCVVIKLDRLKIDTLDKNSDEYKAFKKTPQYKEELLARRRKKWALYMKNWRSRQKEKVNEQQERMVNVIDKCKERSIRMDKQMKSLEQVKDENERLNMEIENYKRENRTLNNLVNRLKLALIELK